MIVSTITYFFCLEIKTKIMIKRFLFLKNDFPKSVSISLFILRVVFGGMLMTHGWAKFMNFSAIAPNFMWGEIGLSLAIFAELFCSAGVNVGLLYRLALIPMITTMAMAFFVIHKSILVGEGNGELALLYLAVFFILFIIGPGKISIDNFIAKK